jgi:hypothetical protein
MRIPETYSGDHEFDYNSEAQVFCIAFLVVFSQFFEKGVIIAGYHKTDRRHHS